LSPRPISPTESETAYVLDGLFDHDTALDIREHFTDIGGASDHVFALFALIGKRFSRSWVHKVTNPLQQISQFASELACECLCRQVQRLLKASMLAGWRCPV
jgi:hypothetical protein